MGNVSGTDGEKAGANGAEALAVAPAGKALRYAARGAKDRLQKVQHDERKNDQRGEGDECDADIDDNDLAEPFDLHAAGMAAQPQNPRRAERDEDEKEKDRDHTSPIGATVVAVVRKLAIVV
ncbi:MAG: hypothetical protein AAF321_12820, partial [Pseudomonadota bacterium]